MPSVADCCHFLDDFAPLALAESWDNVGLLLGDSSRPVARLMTCLTLTPSSVDEAVRGGANLVVAHHPLPFRPLARITTESSVGRLLLSLAEARVAVYSPHTAFDSAREGINQQWAERLGLEDVEPLTPVAIGDQAGLGSGRRGRLASGATLGDLARRLLDAELAPRVGRVGPRERPVSRIGVACGSGGSFLSAADAAGCDVLITGEANFHACLEAEALGIGLLLTGHFASERFALEELARKLAAAFPDVEVWASRTERDPVEWTRRTSRNTTS